MIKNKVVWIVLVAVLGIAVSGSALAQTAPVITSISPPRQVVNIEQNLVLAATISSATPVAMQWKRNGLPVAGATASSFTITNAAPIRDSGWYQLVATNVGGTTTSQVVFVNVAVTSPRILVWGDSSANQFSVPAGLTSISTLTGGSAHLLALRSDGTVVGWGFNGNGETNVPAGLASVVTIAAAGHSLALRADGTVVAWGYNANGQTRIPSGLSSVVRIAAGGETSLALKSDGTVVAWGFNGNGETNVPVGLANVIGIAVGGSHCVALRADGTVVAWGKNTAGQATVPVSLSNVVQIAAGSSHTAALKADGTVVTFGGSYSVVPLGLNNVVAISSAGGGETPLALRSDGTVVAWGNNSGGMAVVPAGTNRVVGLAAGGNYSSALRDASGDATPTITAQPAAQAANVGQSVSFSVAASAGTAPLLFQWRKDGVNIPGATSANYSIGSVSSGLGGYYDVVVSNYLGSVTSAAVFLAVGPAPSITGQPVSLTAFAGQSVRLSVSAVGSPAPSYQWRKDAVAISGASNATLMFASVQPSDAGSYTCVVTNGAGSVISAPAILTVLPAARLTNASVRAALGNAQSLIVGFSVSGGAKDVLVRAAGPALVPFGVVPAMVDPRLELYKDSTKLLENDNWPAVLAGTFGSLGAFPFAANSRDAALLQNVTGSHSAVVSGSGSGVVLVEVYDADGSNPARLINLSARNRVGTGADILIAGFYIAGTGTKRVLLRAVGPTIGGVPFNVPGTLADPKLELYDAAGVKIVENDNWESSLGPTFASVGAFPLAPGSKDAALIAMLSAGSSYSVQVKGADGGTGEALVEIYELP